MSDVQITGDDLLDMVQKKVLEDYSTTYTLPYIENRWIEQENDTKQIYACFQFKDKIGVLKVLVEAEIENAT